MCGRWPTRATASWSGFPDKLSSQAGVRCSADVVADRYAEFESRHLGRWRRKRLGPAHEVERRLVERGRARALFNPARDDAALAVEGERQLYVAVLVARLRALRIALVALEQTHHLPLPGRDGVRVADVDLALLWCGRNDGFLDLGRLRRGCHLSGGLGVTLDLFRTRFRRQRRHRDLGILSGLQVRLLLFDFGDFADLLWLVLDLLDRLWSGLPLLLVGPRRQEWRIGRRHGHRARLTTNAAVRLTSSSIVFQCTNAPATPPCAITTRQALRAQRGRSRRASAKSAITAPAAFRGRQT